MTDNDQAAVEALCKIKHEIRGRSVQGTWSKERGIGVDGARAILDAIRAGKVPIPGMVTEKECALVRCQVKIQQGLLDASREIGRQAQREADSLRSWVEQLKDCLDDEKHQHRKDVAMLTEGQRLLDEQRREAIAAGERRMRDGDEALARARAERDRLAVLLREIRNYMHIGVRSDAMTVHFTQPHVDRIDAALAEVGS